MASIIGKQPRATTHFHKLDALRGIAAVVVMLSHITEMSLGYPLAQRKYLAVQFFFALSGFVIAHAYEARLKQGMSFGDFMLRRVIRLYPLIVLSILVGLIVVIGTNGRFRWDAVWMTAVAMGLVAFPMPLPGGSGAFPYNPPEWSLFYEIILSALYAAGLYMTRSAIVGAITLFALCSYIVVVYAYPLGFMPLWANVFGAVASFGIGMLLMRCVQYDRMPRFPNIPWPLTAVVFLGISCIPLNVGPWVDFVCVLAVFPFVIITYAVSSPPDRVSSALGDLSYPLYVLHWPIAIGCLAVLRGVSAIVATPITCMMAVFAAWIALRLFDLPVRAVLSGHLSRVGGRL